MPEPARTTLDGLVRRYRLSQDARDGLARLAALLATDPLAPTTVRDPARVLEDHLADALVALELDCVQEAGSLADLGAGAGVPGLPLAIALPGLAVTLVEATSRKCSFLARAVEELRLDRVQIAHARAEELAVSARDRFDVVTARALAAPAVVAEYAAPLLRLGGTLVAWRGSRDPQAELEGERAATELGLAVGVVVAVSPYAQAERRHLHLMSKVRDTPDRFPRRPGMPTKRPLGRR